MVQAFNITISGIVQNVGFRYYTKIMANNLAIVGFVRNLSNGHVYIECQGEEEKIKQFIKWCKSGSDRARVEILDIVSTAPKDFLDFQIK